MCSDTPNRAVKSLVAEWVESAWCGLDDRLLGNGLAEQYWPEEVMLDLHLYVTCTHFCLTFKDFHRLPDCRRVAHGVCWRSDPKALG